MWHTSSVYRVGALVGLAALLFGLPSYGQDYEREVVESADAFEQVLSPHGDWYDSDEHGRLWVPHRAVVGENFVPYSTAGHWESTDHGWLFVSHWHWGWAPFHYGNWIFDPDLGWAWVPGDVWAPAWVRWRSGNEYIGWMPEPPLGYGSPDSWVFVHTRDFCRPRIWRHLLHRHRYTHALRGTSHLRDRVRVRHYRWYRGPRIDVVRRASAYPVRTVRLAAPSRNALVRIERRGGRTYVRHSKDRVRVRRRRARVRRGYDRSRARRRSTTIERSSGARAVDRRRHTGRSRYQTTSDPTDRRVRRRPPSAQRRVDERRPRQAVGSSPRGRVDRESTQPRRRVDTRSTQRRQVQGETTRRTATERRQRQSRRRVQSSGVAPATGRAARSSSRRPDRARGSSATTSKRRQSSTSSRNSTASQSKRRRRPGGSGRPVTRRRAPATK